jgi:hypothetical protein
MTPAEEKLGLIGFGIAFFVFMVLLFLFLSKGWGGLP